MCSNGSKTTKIGATIDANSHIGKEQKIDMAIAAQNFKDPGRDPLQAVYAVSIAPTSLLKQGLQPAVRGPKVCICWLGNSNLRLGKEQISRPQSSPTRPTTLWLPYSFIFEELIKEEEQVIVRMETWHEATLVASIGNREQVPILSLASAATISPPSTALRWPFLVQIATNGSQQVNCFTSILQSYKWKKVIAIYEDDTYGSDSSGLALLSESLLSIGTEIEFSRHSLLFLIHKEAKQLGLVGRDSVWIITNAISSLLDSVNTSVISNMQVYWPGKLVNDVPKGWTMPSEAKKLKIGVLVETAFEMFVKVVEHSNGEKSYLGFCIEVFEKNVEVLGYDLPYKFEPFHSSYDDLVLCVGNKCDNFGFFSYVDQIGWKTYDAIVGDTTTLADRFELVRFTQSFLSSGLPMIVLVKTEEAKASTFIKPFTIEMWIVTALLMIYTMFVVWFLEHQSNPEFRGPWKTQLSTTMWFTFSSLFFSHREKIYSNYTRVVVVMWLFVVFVVTSSYTANLTSLLTVPRLEPTVTDIEFLRRTSAIVGCDGDSYVKHYLVNVLQFKEHNMKAVGSQYNYLGEFESGNITAAFLEPPYEKIFLRENCNKYTVSGPTYKFGGWGFVQESQGKTTTPSIRSLWRKMFSFARYFHNGGLELQGVLQPLMAHGMCGALGSGSW
ncbi:unnamed protein product [Camellia sinensis]